MRRIYFLVAMHDSQDTDEEELFCRICMRQRGGQTTFSIRCTVDPVIPDPQYVCDVCIVIDRLVYLLNQFPTDHFLVKTIRGLLEAVFQAALMIYMLGR